MGCINLVIERYFVNFVNINTFVSHAVTILSKCGDFIGYALFDRSMAKSSTYRMIFLDLILQKLGNLSIIKNEMLFIICHN